MMKKQGFTLAEVLITLTIIGVIATMTLPALMTNTQEQQAKTGLKKGLNTLTEIAQMSQAIAGFDYASLTEDTPEAPKPSDADGQHFFGIVASRANVDLSKTTNIPTLASFGADSTIYLRDGSAIIFKRSATKTTDTNGALQVDGLPLGFTVVYDTNGAKGPNILSNCNGAALGAHDGGDDWFKAASDALFVTQDYSACDTKAKRVIKDQFAVRLRGLVAQPDGKASTWVMLGDGAQKAKSAGTGSGSGS